MPEGRQQRQSWRRSSSGKCKKNLMRGSRGRCRSEKEGDKKLWQGRLRGDGGEPGSWSMTTRWRRGSAGMNRRSFLDEWQRWKIWFKIQTAQCCETQPLLLLFEFRRPGWSERT